MRLFVRNTARSLLAGFFLAFFSAASAQGLPPIIGCNDNGNDSTAELAVLSFSGIVSNTWETCPLLEEKEPFKLVEKFGETTLFAYDFGIPFTCFSGDVFGTLTYIDTGETVSLEGVALSAQRLFPVPDGQDIPGTGFGLVANSILGDLGAGAAMTWVQFDDNAVLLDDHFLASASPDGMVSDTEDFLIVGASGSIRLSGRLAGRGALELGVIPGEDQTFVEAIVFEEISGFVCVR